MSEALEDALKAEPSEIDEDYVATVFGKTGLLAEKFQGYEPRRGQVELAYEVDEALKGETTLLAEAPTGTGKSIGYSVPAAFHAGVKHKKVVIVTANIALQEQLVKKDLPLLREVLPYTFSFALAKGLNNYLCLDQYDDSYNELLLDGLGDPKEQEQWDAVCDWAKSTTTGDLSELPFEPLIQLRSKFTTTTDDCLGKKCPRHDECHAINARRTYRDADIVVTNYHLFYADLIIRRGSEDGAGVLPKYRHVIFDEGHRAADIARDFFGFRISSYAIKYATRFLLGRSSKGKKEGFPPINEELRERVMMESDDFFAEVKEYFYSKAYKARLTRPNFVQGDRLVDLLKNAETALLRGAENPDLQVETREEIRRSAARCEALHTNIKQTIDLALADERVYYLEVASRGERVNLHMKPIVVSEDLREQLFEHEDVGGVVVTSATLTTGGKSGFDYVARELGAEDCTELIAESPFDYESNAMLIIPRGIAQPNYDEFADDVARSFIELTKIMGGRTLGLFTSYRVLNEVYSQLVDSMPDFAVFKQGQMPRTKLIERFRSDESSVLLGTESFAEGIDVPGPSLSAVLIDRIPFASPEDPMLAAVSTTNKRWFMEYSMPRAIISFRQRFGRLIRTRTDRGVVVVCDRRITDKPYGKKFVKVLPPVEVVRTYDRIQGFLGGKK